MLPVLARGSDRGSGFSRETPLSVPVSGSRPVPVLCVPPPASPAVPTQVSPCCPPVLLVSRGLQAPRPAQARLRGQQSTGRMVGAHPDPPSTPSTPSTTGLGAHPSVPPIGAVGVHHQQWLGRDPPVDPEPRSTG